jgi:hypothetical protein
MMNVLAAVVVSVYRYGTWVQLQQVGHIKQQHRSIANHNLLLGWRETEERERERQIICVKEEKECQQKN